MNARDVGLVPEHEQRIRALRQITASVQLPLRQLFHSRAAVLTWSRTQRMDVIVTGWAGSPAFGTNDEVVPYFPW